MKGDDYECHGRGSDEWVKALADAGKTHTDACSLFDGLEHVVTWPNDGEQYPNTESTLRPASTMSICDMQQAVAVQKALPCMLGGAPL